MINPTWVVLVISLPTENATVRMRAWRSLKSAGAAVLRDGVYLLPDHPSGLGVLENVAKDVQESGGKAYVLRVADDKSANFPALFDRTEEYASFIADLSQLQASFGSEVPALIKQLRKLRKNFAAIVDTDYFPTPAQDQAENALRAAEQQLNRLLSPDEPHEVNGTIQRLNSGDYQNRNWATRKRPWVDRLASAWLIRRFIDKNARIIWLDSPADCPSDALGFDFDGARFSHIDGKVTFEVLIASFGLEQPALNRLGGVIHYLDVGGIQPAESSGLEQILWGLRNAITDDNKLLAAASDLFDALFTAFTEKV